MGSMLEVSVGNQGLESGTPVMKSLTGLFAQMAFFHHIPQKLGWAELLSDLLMEDFRDRQTDVEPNQIGQFQGPHGVSVAQLHRLVDLYRTGDPVFQHANRLETDDQTQAARRETRRILDHDGLLGQTVCKIHCPVDRRIRSGISPNHFDQCHDRYRVEKVHADKSIG